MPLVLTPQKRTSEIDFDTVNSIAQSLHIENLLAQILYNRGYTTVEACMELLYPDENSLIDPFTMLNMRKAVDEILQINDEKIVVYGDYDVDGTSAVTILVRALKRLNKNVSYYIPDRHTEGYGLHEEALNKIFNDGCKLLITVDCGITSVDLVEKFNTPEHGMIITDHHTIGEKLPSCTVLKPGQPNDKYENPNLCGAGIAFKLAQALIKDKADDLIDYAGVATIADIVPLKGENRYIVKRTLEVLNASPRACFKSLLKESGFEGKINSQTVGFTLAPRINAAGRMATAESVMNLLMENGDTDENAKALCELNQKRQDSERALAEDVRRKITEKGIIRNKKVIVAAGEDWHEGVLGICAARFTEEFKRPCLLFSIKDGVAKGSGRSVEGINLYELLSSASDLLIQFGGHKMAAGMSLKAENLDKLEDRLNEIITENCDLKSLYPVASYDAKAEIKDITLDFLKHLDLLEPFGCENGEVTLRIDNCTVGGVREIGAQKNHLKFMLDDTTGKLSSIAFSYEKHDCDYFNLTRASVIGNPEINVWQGAESPNFKVINVKDTENVNPMHNAEYLTAKFFSRLRFVKDGSATVNTVEQSEEMSYMISEWADDVTGTLILCDHPEYAKGVIKLLEDEAPRFDISFTKPLNSTNGYNSLVIGAEIDKTDFTPFKRVVFYDMLNAGYADYIHKIAPWLEMYSLKCGLELFDSLFEEYCQFSRENMAVAYKTVLHSLGTYNSETEFLTEVSSQKQVTMPLLCVALYTFTELGFFEIKDNFTLSAVANQPKHSLEESRYYNNIMKCLSKRGKQ